MVIKIIGKTRKCHVWNCNKSANYGFKTIKTGNIRREKYCYEHGIDMKCQGAFTNAIMIYLGQELTSKQKGSEKE